MQLERALGTGGGEGGPAFRALGNPVLVTEGHVTLVDGLLACVVLLGLVLNAALSWWWADPAAAVVIIYYAIKEARAIYSAP